MKRSLKTLLFRQSFRSYISGHKYGYKVEAQYRLLDFSRVLRKKDYAGRRFVVPFIQLLRFLRITNSKIATLTLNQLPWNPPATTQSGSYSIYLLVGPRDLSIFLLSLSSLKTQLPPTSKHLTVVCPASIKVQIFEQIKGYLNSEIQIDILTDEELLDHFNLNRNDFPNSHVFMQVAKFLLAIYSALPKSLVLDGDTLFLRSRIWDSGNSEMLVIPPEYEITHAEFSRSLLQLPRVSTLGYTTQSQLLSKAKVQELIVLLGGFESVTQKFGKAYLEYLAGINTNQFPCEWQLYGDWLRLIDSSRISFVAYSNVSVSRDILKQRGLDLSNLEETEAFIYEIQSKYPEIGSLSFHHYKQNSTNIRGE